MKIIGALSLDCKNLNNIEITSSTLDLSFVGFFYRNNMEELLIFYIKEVIKTIYNKKDNTTRHIIYHDQTKSNIMFYVVDKMCFCIICDEEYPQRVVFGLLNSLSTMNDLSSKDIVEKYQNPNETDNIMKIQKQLNETKEIMHNTIESVLDQNEKLDELVMKSNKLSYTSKKFYVQAKRNNSCCSVL